MLRSVTTLLDCESGFLPDSHLFFDNAGIPAQQGCEPSLLSIVRRRLTMSYTDTSQLPLTIREVLPPEAQELYLTTYNGICENYKPDVHQTMPVESLAHQMAWDMVTREFVKDDRTKQWYRKGEVPVPDEEPKGILQRLKAIF
jgi:cation transport regulator ChaB